MNTLAWLGWSGWVSCCMSLLTKGVAIFCAHCARVTSCWLLRKASSCHQALSLVQTHVPPHSSKLMHCLEKRRCCLTAHSCARLSILCTKTLRCSDSYSILRCVGEWPCFSKVPLTKEPARANIAEPSNCARCASANQARGHHLHH